MYDALGPSVPFKILYMWQGPHGIPDAQTYPDYQPLLDRFFAHTLKGIDNGIEREPPVHTMGRTGSTVDARPRVETAWPPPGTRGLALSLGRTSAGGVLSAGAGGDPVTYTDMGTGSEERAIEEGVTQEDGWVFYETAPVTAPVRLAGSAVLEADITDSADHGQLSPTLVDVGPDGTVVPISRGHLNLQYRSGLAKAIAVPAGQPDRVRPRAQRGARRGARDVARRPGAAARGPRPRRRLRGALRRRPPSGRARERELGRRRRAPHAVIALTTGRKAGASAPTSGAMVGVRARSAWWALSVGGVAALLSRAVWSGWDRLAAQQLMTCLCLLAAVGAVARATRATGERGPARLFAAGVVLWAAGSVTFTTLTTAGIDVPIPSAADVLWLSSYLGLYAGLTLVVRAG